MRNQSVAIVGSGPSAFFAAQNLLRSDSNLKVDMYERLPVPFGLVRFGVAPDHQKIKAVTRVFDTVAGSERFRFFGNVRVGHDIGVETLTTLYSALLIATGASGGTPLGIKNEWLPGIVDAADFVGWYNGHPDYASLPIDLATVRSVVIIGQGNVACDVARILASAPDRLAASDISGYALSQLRTSSISSIRIVGRRGPAQLKVTAAELRELVSLEGWHVAIDPRYLELNDVSLVELADSRSAMQRTLVEILSTLGHREHPHGADDRIIEFDFLRSPKAVQGTDRVTGLELTSNRLSGPPFGQIALSEDTVSTVPCDLLVRCVGYRGQRVDGIPFDDLSARIPNLEGRVVDAQGNRIPGLYTTGWIKRGPTGVIGTNLSDSTETTKHMLGDLVGMPADRPAPDLAFIRSLTKSPIVSWNDWCAINEQEISSGRHLGKPREKLTSIEDMIHTGLSKDITA
ncbi:FAD-dependent oxidoreductase [Trinickia acidisoli]|uniref:FAD-dependent oxidoreductase n=1 Tax=Trinickia acidisoli TaxID=2767482 RepID=UPI001A8CE663|nr:FAD-dependent oxidoreductase [Trinickia acidisoli]